MPRQHLVGRFVPVRRASEVVSLRSCGVAGPKEKRRPFLAGAIRGAISVLIRSPVAEKK